MALAGRIRLSGVDRADKFRRRTWRDEHVESVAIQTRKGNVAAEAVAIFKARQRGGGTNKTDACGVIYIL